MGAGTIATLKRRDRCIYFSYLAPNGIPYFMAEELHDQAQERGEAVGSKA